MPAKLDLPPAFLDIICQLIEQHAPGAEVWAYGSRVTGGAHEASDLDLVLRNPIALDIPQRSKSVLADAFVESNLPIMIDVLDWAQLPESFQSEIKRNHVMICSRDAK